MPMPEELIDVRSLQSLLAKLAFIVELVWSTLSYYYIVIYQKEVSSAIRTLSLKRY